MAAWSATVCCWTAAATAPAADPPRAEAGLSGDPPAERSDANESRRESPLPCWAPPCFRASMRSRTFSRFSAEPASAIE